MGSRTIIGVSSTAGDEATYLARAAAALGTTSFAWFWDDLYPGSTNVPNGWADQSTNGGTSDCGPLGGPNTLAGGVCRASTGTSANGTGSFRHVGGGFVNPGQRACWFGAKLRINTAMPATTLGVAHLQDLGGSSTTAVGFIPALNSTNFIVQHSGTLAGSAINLGVALDTGWHVFEVKMGGANNTIWGRIDGGLWIPGTITVPHLYAARIFTQVNTASTGVNRSVDFDWFGLATVR